MKVTYNPWQSRYVLSSGMRTEVHAQTARADAVPTLGGVGPCYFGIPERPAQRPGVGLTNGHHSGLSWPRPSPSGHRLNRGDVSGRFVQESLDLFNRPSILSVRKGVTGSSQATSGPVSGSRAIGDRGSHSLCLFSFVRPCPMSVFCG